MSMDAISLAPVWDVPFRDNDSNEVIAAIQANTDATAIWALSYKTASPCWRDVQEELDKLTWSGPVVQEVRLEKNPTLGEMTLEDFLLKAGIVRESDEEERRKTLLANLVNQRQRKRILKNMKSETRARQSKQPMAVTMRIDGDNPQQLNLREKENDREKENAAETFSSGPGFAQSKVVQSDSSSQQSMTEVDGINRANVVCTDPNGTNIMRKESKMWTLEKEYGISREVLEQYSGKKLKDVANILGVSRSTLKRICRKHDIIRWPPRKAKKSNGPLTKQEHIQTTQEKAKESTQKNQLLDDPAQKSKSLSHAPATSHKPAVLNATSIVVKATYKGDMIKFQLPVSSRMLNLEEEVATRLKLSVGSFKIKYQDEDDDWILITGDIDLRTCISSLGSLGKATIKMLVAEM